MDEDFWNKSFAFQGHLTDICDISWSKIYAFFLAISSTLQNHFWGLTSGESERDPMNENYPAHTHQTHPSTSTHPLLYFLIIGTYHLELNPNSLCCLTKTNWSGPWIPLSPFFIHYSSKPDFPQILQYSKLVPVLKPLYFLFPLPSVLSPHLSMLVSAQVSPPQRSLLHLSHHIVTATIWNDLIHFFP